MRFPVFSLVGGAIAIAVAIVVGVSTIGVAQTENSGSPDAALQDNAPVPLPEAITLGQPCDSPYVVAIPYANEVLLDRVQTVVAAAFITDSRFGPYVHAGTSPRRVPAEQVSRQLRRAGFDARVIYRPIACGP